MEGLADAKALSRSVLGVETQQGDQCGCSGVEEERPSLERDVRPSAGAQFLKQVQAQVLIPLIFFPLLYYFSKQ